MSSLAPCICKCVMVSNLNQKSASQLGLRLWSVELASPTTHTLDPQPPTPKTRFSRIILFVSQLQLPSWQQVSILQGNCNYR